MQSDSITSSFRAFVKTNFPRASQQALKDDDALLASGIIDSLGVLDLVSFIESEFSIAVVDEDLIPENFQTIHRMTMFVERKRSGEI